MCVHKCAFWIVCMCILLQEKSNFTTSPTSTLLLNSRKIKPTTAQNNGKSLYRIFMMRKCRWTTYVAFTEMYNTNLHVCFQNDSTCWKVCDCIYCFSIAFWPHFSYMLYVYVYSVQHYNIHRSDFHCMCIDCGWLELWTIQCTRGV